MIVPNYFQDLHVLHDNTMPARAYYIPASESMDTLVEHRTDSDRMQLLNGDWKFRFYDTVFDVKEEFYSADYDVSGYETMAVPSVWQMKGYDYHQYTNIRYPFPFDPPYVPHDNPCGAYVRDFMYEIDEHAPRAYLNFEGVDSCFYVWLNGKYVGYSQVSHSTSEFDISDVLRTGNNRLAVLVVKWCDGSYLEDQDKFRMSGIFRDVYLLKRPEHAVYDYFIKSEISETEAVVTVDFKYFDRAVPTDIVIYDLANNVKASQKISGGDERNKKTSLAVLHPKLWCPEHPYLYKIEISTKNECIVDYIGFRTIEIRDRVLYFNGEKIKFRGVNRHDSDPVTGFTISLEQMMRDLTMMKRHNFNAIRTSHYPNAPYFYQLCDKYGFMVIDEADIEAHGPSEIFYADNTEQNKFNQWNKPIADNPVWEEAIIDRVKLCVERDKNRTCVVIWSMGNESAYGCNFEKALAWTKRYDASRLTHYESARYRNRDKSYGYSNLDLFSRMYPSFDEIHDYLDNEPDKPLILCEYCHSMGNGPGDLEDYFELFRQNDLMCGGFVWEWYDHAVAHGTSGNGKTVYYYGGDHGEAVHDGNFCMDGLVYPDRTPHTGLLEYKNVYRPARVQSYDSNTGVLMLKNYMDFTALEDYVNIRYEVSCDGVITEAGMLSGFSIAPHESGAVKLIVEVPKKGRCYLTLHYEKKQEDLLVTAGHELGFDELLLENEDGRNQCVQKMLDADCCGASPVTVSEDDASIICRGYNFTYVLDRRTGLFRSIVFEGKEYLDAPMQLNIWRAPTDNDMYIKTEWKRAGYDRAYTRAYDTVVSRFDNGIEIKSTLALLADAVQRMMDVEIIWRIDNSGGIAADICAKRNMEFPVLPRFGLRMFLDKGMENVSYYGMGPMESYRDKHRAARHGLYQAKVAELHEDYIRPQENGSHFDCDYVILDDGRLGLAAASEKPFSFNASRYSQEELEHTAHNYQLTESGSTILCLDYNQNGIGSNSCGQEVMKQYQLADEEIVFHIMMKPFVKER